MRYSSRKPQPVGPVFSTRKKVVYPLYFKGKYCEMLFGIYTSMEKAEEARERYLNSGKCGLDIGYFKPIEAVTTDLDLAKGYL